MSLNARLLDVVRQLALEASAPPTQEESARALSAIRQYCAKDSPAEEAAFGEFYSRADTVHPGAPIGFDDLEDPVPSLFNANCVLQRVRATGGRCEFLPIAMLEPAWQQAIYAASMCAGIEIILTNKKTVVTLAERARLKRGSTR